MSWRALMRRAPTKSFTVVGDVAQTSSAGGTDSWAAALSPYIQDRLQVEHLTVNYRTPRRIMDRAVAMAQAHDLPVTAVSSVRDGDRDPLIERTADAELAARAADAVTAVHEERLGRTAVIAAQERVEELVSVLRTRAGLPAIGVGSAGVDDEIAVMTAQDAKGLEFDAVVIVEPAELIDAHGAGDLYVAMSRPTQHLGVIHCRHLPAGISD
jgi:DNA helicase IV